MMTVDPEKRYSIPQVLRCRWVTQDLDAEEAERVVSFCERPDLDRLPPVQQSVVELIAQLPGVTAQQVQQVRGERRRREERGGEGERRWQVQQVREERGGEEEEGETARSERG